ASVILTLMHREAKSAVIVCPAMARKVWIKELARWWPGHPDVTLCDTGAKARAATSPLQVVSYGLLTHLPPRKGVPAAIILDEIHYLMNPSSRRSKAVKDLCERYPDAFRAGMTGTIFTNQPSSAWNPLDTLWPGRAGTYFKWNKRYTDAYHNGYGWEFQGLNKDNADELRHRMQHMASRVTKADVSHLLPEFTTQNVYLVKDRVTDA
ncbi:MAG: hypothetical protein GTO63_27300, partial [Anaerolineae bacterium]|nr:hypothetical protein [Anaerolineae bacterium]NIN98433.1 hypothetical protein [Anaerolineae bacterium]NIQ81341.1 hypothetical protein [Anaerolineae bacterium]